MIRILEDATQVQLETIMVICIRLVRYFLSNYSGGAVDAVLISNMVNMFFYCTELKTLNALIFLGLRICATVGLCVCLECVWEKGLHLHSLNNKGQSHIMSTKDLCCIISSLSYYFAFLLFVSVTRDWRWNSHTRHFHNKLCCLTLFFHITTMCLFLLQPHVIYGNQYFQMFCIWVHFMLSCRPCCTFRFRDLCIWLSELVSYITACMVLRNVHMFRKK